MQQLANIFQLHHNSISCAKHIKIGYVLPAEIIKLIQPSLTRLFGNKSQVNKTKKKNEYCLFKKRTDRIKSNRLFACNTHNIVDFTCASPFTPETLWAFSYCANRDRRVRWGTSLFCVLVFRSSELAPYFTPNVEFSMFRTRYECQCPRDKMFIAIIFVSQDNI